MPTLLDEPETAALAPRLLPDVPAAEYHADTLGLSRPSLSSSIAHTIVSQSPFHAWLRHPKFGKQAREATADMDNGTLIHALVLGTECEICPIDADNYRTKAAQEQRDAARENGLTPILRRDLDDAQNVARAITEELASLGIDLRGGQREVTVVWEEPSESGPVVCRGRMDHVEGVTITDLKTCRSAHPRGCTSHVMEYGCHLQAEAYKSALRQLSPEAAGRERFRWVFVETLPAGSPKRVVVTVAEPSGAMRELGSALWRQAVETWGRCLAANVWPAYAVEPVRLEPPAWAMNELTEGRI